MNSENRFYVYTYSYPNGTPFYVGKGTNKRIEHHLWDAKAGRKLNSYNVRVVRKLLSEGKEPIVNKIVDNIDEELAFLVEQEFIAKYGKRNDGSGIGGANVRFYNENSDTSLQKVYVSTGYGNFKDGESIRITGKQTVGTVYSWSANTSTLIAKDLTDLLNINDEVNGDESNARYIVSALGDTYYALAKTITIQNPLSANGVGDFGFSSTIFEFPNA